MMALAQDVLARLDGLQTESVLAMRPMSSSPWK
jgi:hypothetical protein